MQFADIYERYIQKVYNYAYYRMGDPSEAEDLDRACIRPGNESPAALP